MHKLGIRALLGSAVATAAALAVAAESGTPLTQLADELDRPERRLDILEVDGLPGIRAAFTLSFRRLPAAAQEAFTLLAAAAGPEFDKDAAAAVLGTDPLGAGALIAELHRSNLLRQTGRDHYAFDDLVRLFAQEQLTDAIPYGVRV